MQREFDNNDTAQSLRDLCAVWFVVCPTLDAVEFFILGYRLKIGAHNIDLLFLAALKELALRGEIPAGNTQDGDSCGTEIVAPYTIGKAVDLVAAAVVTDRSVEAFTRPSAQVTDGHDPLAEQAMPA